MAIIMSPVSDGGFALGTADNVFDAGTGSRTDAEALRDAYATANTDWLAEYDANEQYNILLKYVDDDSNAVAVYQIRIDSTWLDNTSAIGVRGLPGEDGMVASTYDPTGIEGDAFDMDNMVEGATNLILTATERLSIATLPKVQFQADTTDTITISDDPDNPSYITGLTLDSESSDFVPTLTGASADEDTGAIVNNTGKTLYMAGDFTYQPNNQGSTSRLQMWSERSLDGITWTENQYSGRTIEVSSTSESTGTKRSNVSAWLPGEYLRFAIYDSGGGSITFEPIVISVNGGTNNVTSVSFDWFLLER